MGMVMSVISATCFCMERVVKWACCTSVSILLMLAIIVFTTYGVLVGYNYSKLHNTEKLIMISGEYIEAGNHYRYLPVENRTSVNFHVRANKDAFIMLTAERGLRPVPNVELLISNPLSVIRRETEHDKFVYLVNASTLKYLSKEDYRKFYLSWEGGVIMIRKWEEEAAFLACFIRDIHPINYIGVAGSSGATSEFIFQGMKGTNVIVRNPSLNEKEHFTDLT